MNIDADRIIVALDVSTREEALKIVKELEGFVDFYKVGSELFINEGPRILKELKKLDKRIFLDLKLHDIPNTVYKATRAILNYDIDMLTVHILGGVSMLKRAVEAVRECSLNNEGIKTKLIGVTALTSLDEEDFKDLGINLSVADFVKRLSLLAKKVGVDGVVASAREVKAIKELCGNNFLVITPGIRTSLIEKNDQKRIVTAQDAFSLGADYIVVGRAITSSLKPMEAFRKLFT